MSQHRLKHTFRGRQFVALGLEPYTRLDGTETQLMRWQSACIECGAAFEVKTPASGFEASKAFGRCRCDAHKKTNAQILTGWNVKKTADKPCNAVQRGATLQHVDFAHSDSLQRNATHPLGGVACCSGAAPDVAE